MPLSAVSTMALPAAQTMAKEDEAVMKDCWQCTVRSEKTKDTAGSLPLAVCFQSKQTEHSYVKFNREQAAPGDSSTRSPVTETTEPSEHSPASGQFNFRKRP